MPFVTTLQKLKDNDACKPRFDHLVESLGEYGFSEPISISKILETNGVQDALWALRACDLTKNEECKVHLLACDFAEHVLPSFEREFPNDKRPRSAIEVKRKWAHGEATEGELTAARSAAASAASAASAAYSAVDAAYYSADYSAVVAAYYSADYAAAAQDEWDWQATKLTEMIEG
jgi:hypothetical protein